MVAGESPLFDAIIIWKKPKDSVWNIYDKPLRKNIPFEAKAVRIGYEESEVLVH
ncbi:hypothetical protein GGR42_000789 [Saonia flava]|uniref:Uncharacterized protein n=1 Tax=Saonia flava TaxID=523696 RepID=A0A846QSY8_9FLAO|nr:hypothetical protein [Saonia flava]NJB70327.1 hypothetical protein [Saonia flava]